MSFYLSSLAVSLISRLDRCVASALTSAFWVGVETGSAVVTSVARVVLLTKALTGVDVTDLVHSSCHVTLTPAAVGIRVVTQLTSVTLDTTKVKVTRALSRPLVADIVFSPVSSTLASCKVQGCVAIIFISSVCDTDLSATKLTDAFRKVPVAICAFSTRRAAIVLFTGALTATHFAHLPLSAIQEAVTWPTFGSIIIPERTPAGRRVEYFVTISRSQ